ncbi:hypothetical protein QFC21_007198 [Naganishia friedmannii]|uniref:Uncharacterized protein n=1 Tax=Naganishia friedmannii TaxID=89922 RepID=A0ACC2UWK8_9TREE|nr:hypothetical protein QFC21_007198 [Naganishia friedmannii]
MVYMTGIALLAFGLWIHSSWPSFPALTQPEVKNVAGEPWTVWDSSGPYAPPPVWNDTSYESNPLTAGYEVKKIVLPGVAPRCIALRLTD